MRVLRSHHILPLFVWVDNQLGSPSRRVGRRSVLRDSEVATILIFNLLTVQQQTLRQIYDWASQYHQSEFPHLPSYQNFVAHCHRLLSALNELLGHLLQAQASLRLRMMLYRQHFIYKKCNVSQLTYKKAHFL